LATKSILDFNDAATAFTKACVDAGWKIKNMSFTATRIVSVAHPLQRFLMHLIMNIELLLEEEGDPQGQNTTWASYILDHCTYYELCFACCLCEYLLVAYDWVHAFDNAPETQSLCRVRSNNEHFIRQLETLFTGNAPLVLRTAYSKSVFQQVVGGLKKVGALSLCSARRRRLLAIPSDLASRVRPLGEMVNILKITKAELDAHFPSADLQESMAPFDLGHWCGHDRVLDETFAPLARARGVKSADVAAEYIRARSTANSFREATGSLNPDIYWGSALERLQARKTMPALAACMRPALTQFISNGELEGNFSIMQHGFQGGRRDCSDDLLRAEMKIRLDGPLPGSLLTGRVGGVSDFVLKVQRMYKAMYGGRDLTKADAARASSSVYSDRRRGQVSEF
jgi:hypothetical protein